MAERRNGGSINFGLGWPRMPRLCNTPGVYIPLDNEFGFKHVISVDETDTKI
jgi:hypothetical protein